MFGAPGGQVSASTCCSDARAFDEILGLKEKGLRSVVIMALGYRDGANDWLVNLKKVRREKADMFIEVK